MKKINGPRLRPKLKDFVDGAFPYNPILTQESLDTWEDVMGRYTEMISRSLGDPEHHRKITVLIKTRARAARILANERKLILEWRKKHG